MNGRRGATLVESLVAAGVPVYLTREVEGIEDKYSFSGDADLIRVWPRGQSQITQTQTTGPDAEAGHDPLPLLLDNGNIQIEGFTLRPIDGLAQPAQELVLYWRTMAPTSKVLKVSLRLLDESTARQREREKHMVLSKEPPAERDWRREDLYTRGKPR